MKNSPALRALLLALFAVAFVSCAIDNRETADAPGLNNPEALDAEWTVMYYGVGNYAGDMENGLSRTLLTLQALEQAVPSPRVQVVALIGAAATDGHTLMYEIHPGRTTDGDGVQSAVISDWGIRDMSSSAVIAEFADSVALRYPAKKHMLIVGGDGRGWMGVCRDENAGPNSIMPITDMRNELYAVNKPDGTPLRFDLMYWMVPNMGMLEVGYEMKDLVRYMISSATTATVEHYRMMQAWLQDLHGAPEIDGLELGRLIMRSSEEAGTRYRLPVELSLLDVSEIVGVAGSIDVLSGLLADRHDVNPAATSALREQAWSATLDDTSIVDIESLLGAIEEDSGLITMSGMESAIANVRSSLNTVRVERLDTRQLERRFGVTIHFPPFAQQLNLDEYQYLRINRDSIDHHSWNWTRFLSAVSPPYVAPVTMSGLVRYQYAAPLVNVGVFLMTGSTFDDIIVERKAEIAHVNAIGDSANFVVQLSIEESPVTVRFGMFSDPDSNGFDSGDLYGLGSWAPGQPFRELVAGARYDSLSCRLNNTRP